MRFDLRDKNASEVLKCFESMDIENGEIAEIEFFDSGVERFGYRGFVDLAQLFFMKLLPPIKQADATTIMRFKKLDTKNSFHESSGGTEKYGVESEFFSIDKTEEFSFLYHYQKSLEFINIGSKKRVLNLGVNRGDEFRVIKEMLSRDEFSKMEFVGIDYSSSAIEYAKRDFLDDKNVEFICHDINRLSELDLGEFDLIISIGTLQSSNIEFNATLMSIYQNYLQKNGAIILGFPNCRWIDGEMIYGAKVPNYAFNEMGLVLKDIHFCKKYLQQKKYRVIITGKDYICLTARKII